MLFEVPVPAALGTRIGVNTADEVSNPLLAVTTMTEVTYCIEPGPLVDGLRADIAASLAIVDRTRVVGMAWRMLVSSSLEDELEGGNGGAGEEYTGN